MKYTHNKINQLDDDEILLLLKEEWGINKNEPIEVIGELAFVSMVDYTSYRLKKVLLKNGRIIEYPLENKYLYDSR